MRRLLVVLSTLLGAAACGPPKPSEQCDDPGFICADKSTALECRRAAPSEPLAWVEVPCRGPEGCVREGPMIRCDLTANQAGDTCPSTTEGDGMCTADGKGLLTCSNGVLAQTATCSSCTVSGGVVSCAP